MSDQEKSSSESGKGETKRGAQPIVPLQEGVSFCILDLTHDPGRVVEMTVSAGQNEAFSCTIPNSNWRSVICELLAEAEAAGWQVVSVWDTFSPTIQGRHSTEGLVGVSMSTTLHHRALLKHSGKEVALFKPGVLLRAHERIERAKAAKVSPAAAGKSDRGRSHQAREHEAVAKVAARKKEKERKLESTH